MTEHIYLLEEADPAVFFGTNSSNLALLKELYPKLRIMARGTVLKVMGAEEETQELLKVLHRLEKYAARFNNLPETAVMEIVRGEAPGRKSPDGVILYGAYGQPITPRSDRQQEMVRLVDERDLVFATGPAGTGKTFLAIAMAVKLLREKRARRIILSRPAVEAGERLGFLPGEMKDKLDPYLQPLYDALMELVPPARLHDYMDTGVIQIAPLAYMRGRTLSDAVIVLDEAQNTTTHQMRMFLTRLGSDAKMIVTGDMSQVDLPRGVTSGLREAAALLREVEGIGWIAFEREDIMRHGLVRQIVAVYERADRRDDERQTTSSHFTHYISIMAQALTHTDLKLPGTTHVFHGKVRDVYTLDSGLLVMVATDRISAFDVILPEGIPFKGEVLNRIAAANLDATRDIVPNWKIATPDPMVTIGHACEPYKLEVIVRAILTGSAWRAYEAGERDLCGVILPDGMRENQYFDHPILTPTTKADTGHDMNITPEEIVAQGIMTKAELEEISAIALRLFERGTELAKKKGLILVDTKYEFGKKDGKIYLIDEIHTPDSSRYFYADTYRELYEAGKPQRQLSKEFVRQWLIEHGFRGEKGQQVPQMSEEYIASVSDRYIELYNGLMDEPFEKHESENPEERIQANVTDWLRRYGK